LSYALCALVSPRFRYGESDTRGARHLEKGKPPVLRTMTVGTKAEQILQFFFLLALLAAFYGLSLSQEEALTLKFLTGRDKATGSAFSELWLAIGRRSGKSQIAALMAVYEAP
jgi:hypothetical protein